MCSISLRFVSYHVCCSFVATIVDMDLKLSELCQSGTKFSQNRLLISIQSAGKLSHPFFTDKL